MATTGGVRVGVAELPALVGGPWPKGERMLTVVGPGTVDVEACRRWSAKRGLLAFEGVTFDGDIARACGTGLTALRLYRCDVPRGALSFVGSLGKLAFLDLSGTDADVPVREGLRVFHDGELSAPTPAPDGDVLMAKVAGSTLDSRSILARWIEQLAEDVACLLALLPQEARAVTSLRRIRDPEHWEPALASVVNALAPTCDRLHQDASVLGQELDEMRLAAIRVLNAAELQDHYHERGPRVFQPLAQVVARMAWVARRWHPLRDPVIPAGVDATWVLAAMPAVMGWMADLPAAAPPPIAEDVEALIQVGEQASMPSLAIMKMKGACKDADLLGRALWVAFRADRLQARTAEAWKVMAAVPASSQDVADLLRSAVTHNKRFSEEPWDPTFTTMCERLEDLAPIRAVAADLPPGPAAWMNAALDAMAAPPAGFDLAELEVAARGDGFPDFAVIRDLLTREGAPENRGADALARAGWWSKDLPEDLQGLSHPLDVLDRPPPPPERLPVPESFVPSEVLPEDPTDLALITPSAVEAARLGARRVRRKVAGPPDYQALCRLLKKAAPIDYEDQSGWMDPRPDAFVIPDLTRTEVLQTGRYRGPSYVFTPCGGATLVEEDGAFLARGIGAFLQWRQGGRPVAPPPARISRDEVDPRGDEGLAAWLARCPPGSLLMDYRDLPFPVAQPAPPRAHGPRWHSRHGWVFLVECPSCTGPTRRSGASSTGSRSSGRWRLPRRTSECTRPRSPSASRGAGTSRTSSAPCRSRRARWTPGRRPGGRQRRTGAD
ncbi:MAG: hypothetical protein H6736_01445 [Alphaproteobacteria bacterium]|nr:hypothetical protein [Alphaproteobacteria bacterium]MCB9690455.1 hypothetical protein [Alphaproteobacteria bacterium]